MAKILVVDDNAQNRLLLGDILKYHGYEVLEAEDGRQGVELVRTEGPDLVLMDIVMPLMNGMEAARAIRNDPVLKDTRMVAITSLAMKGEPEEIMRAGFDACVTKPIDTRALPGLVKELLDGEAGKCVL